MALTKATNAMITGAAVNVLDYGAVGDGIADDSGAFAAAFAAAQASGVNCVVVPATDMYYLVKDVVMPNGMQMYGIGRKKVYDTTNVADMEGTCAIVYSTIGGTFCMAFAGSNTVQNINFFGVDQSCSGFGAGSGDQLLFRDVSMQMFHNGFGQASGYTGNSRLWNCHANQNVNGIVNFVDSHVYGAEINANTNIGVIQQAGANDTTFVGCKNEWNGNLNWSFYQSSNCSIVGGVTDRAQGDYGFDVRQSNLTLNDTMIRRNGRNSTTTSAHFLLGSNSVVVMSGVETATGRDDDGTGNLTPAYIFAGTDASTGPVYAAACSFTGYTTGVNTGSTLDGVFTSCAPMVNTVRELAAGSSLSVATSGTVSASVPTSVNTTVFSTDSLGVARYRAIVNTRNQATGAIAFNDFVFGISRGGSFAAASTIYAVANAASTSVNTTGATVNVSITNLATDGSSFDVTATNTGVATLQIFIKVLPYV